jgi:hypothetical protein
MDSDNNLEIIIKAILSGLEKGLELMIHSSHN